MKFKCKNPNCLLHFTNSYKNLVRQYITNRTTLDISNNKIKIEATICPECNNALIKITIFNIENGEEKVIEYPFTTGREILSDSIPEEMKNTFIEAVKVSKISNRAGVVLARLLLHDILVEQEFGTHKDSLNKIVNKAIESTKIPSELSKNLHLLRETGNKGIHKWENIKTGEIIGVESTDIETCLDIIEELFDFFYIKPAFIKSKRKKINEDLEKMGKPKLFE
jgi:hypothetical protein